MKIALMIPLVLLAVGCSTYRKEQCERMNWREKGYDIAQAGYSKKGQLKHFRRHCSEEHGVPVNLQQFDVGYQLGLDQFCTRESGTRYGATGKEYRNTCVGRNEDEFLKAYNTGYLIFSRQEIKRLRGEVSYLESKVSDLESENNRLRSQVDDLSKTRL